MDARRQFWLVDRHGLVTRGRADADSLPDHALPYCHEGPPCADLAAAVAEVRPSVLIGICDGAPSVQFSRGICEDLARLNSRPIIMPLSLPGTAPLPTPVIDPRKDIVLSLKIKIDLLRGNLNA